MASSPTPTSTPLPTPPPIEASAQVPYWLKTEFQLLGMTLIAIGAMAFFIHQNNSFRQRWGFRVIFLGVTLVIVGTGLHWVNNLLKYVVNI